LRRIAGGSALVPPPEAIDTKGNLMGSLSPQTHDSSRTFLAAGANPRWRSLTLGKRVGAAIAAPAASLLLLVTPAHADEPSPTANAAADAVTQSAPGALADASGTGSVSTTNGSVTVSGDNAAPASIGESLTDGLSIVTSSGDKLTVKPLGVDSDASSATPVARGAAVAFAGTDPAVTTLVRPTDGGISTYQVIAGTDAPEEFKFRVDLPGDQKLTRTDDGGLAVINDAGETVATAAPAWAKDATGNQLANVTFSINGSVVTLHVPHRSQAVSYPVTADPQWCGAYVGRAWWTRRSGAPADSLFVSPTWCGRAFATVAHSASFNEAFRKAGPRPYNGGIMNSLFNQFACHADLAQWKPEWHLDTFIPDRGYWGFVRHWTPCN
jgi:hypothetical protein